VFKIIEPKETI